MGNMGQVSLTKELKAGKAQGSPRLAGISTWLCGIPVLFLIPGISATQSRDQGLAVINGAVRWVEFGGKKQLCCSIESLRSSWRGAKSLSEGAFGTPLSRSRLSQVFPLGFRFCRVTDV